ncbi:unnamed protein product [Ostreobium quekettii]|uniref:HD domain-containing protein n=1 Tax=Ostreobium quekettii TaxID=121088 RepID=A0A8S1JFS7_9CHLO|nr:unnamed protein product [Ostreobium quekettii]|eukprot:evm.model.scf_574.9 EVM.evm.TU.scf_574.9   scf_574:64222-68019(-)
MDGVGSRRCAGDDDDPDYRTPVKRCKTGSGEETKSLVARRNTKIFNDMVHGSIELSPLAVDIMDSTTFQRMRSLRQLGFAAWVYPSAEHSRFQHSIGVAHLAATYMQELINHSSELQAMDQEDRRRLKLLAEIAGLCHDLGHGPFSHAFEKTLLPRLGYKPRNGDQHWAHEDMSLKLLDRIIDQKGLDLEQYGLDQGDVGIIGDLILGRDTTGMSSQSLNNGYVQPFLYEIVACKRNGIDVDKVDYLQRDGKNCGINCSTTFDRLPKFMRVIDGVLCFSYQNKNELQNLLTDRRHHYKRIYHHRKGVAIELMMSDALVEANGDLDISSKVDDPEAFERLDDSLINVVKNWSSPSAGMKRAQDLMRRVDARDLYSFCNEVVVPQERVHEFKKAPKASDITTCQNANGTRLTPEDIHVVRHSLDHGMKDRDPLECVQFYHKTDGGGETILHEGEYTLDKWVERMQEVRIRVYSKKREKMVAVRSALKQWAERTFGTSELKFGTPEGPRRCDRLLC